MDEDGTEDICQVRNRDLNLTEEEGDNWGMMRAAWSSVADMAIVPMQELIGLGSEARINIPSTLGENWKWRALEGQITKESGKETTINTCRCMDASVKK